MFSKEMQREISIQAIRTFGENLQKIKAIEELGELSTALARDFTKEGQDGILDNIAEECADVEIMLDQLREIYGDAFIDKWKHKKLEKLNGVVW